MSKIETTSKVSLKLTILPLDFGHNPQATVTPPTHTYTDTHTHTQPEKGQGTETIISPIRTMRPRINKTFRYRMDGSQLHIR